MSSDDDFSRFLRCLSTAGQSIGSHYFQIARANAAERQYRERVYCYELYHQLRVCLTDSFPYKLQGELDKAGNPTFHEQKPDFVVHEPGSNDKNLVVMEVKPITVKMKGLRKDLDTLNHFLGSAQYHHAIMLVYGNQEGEIPNWIPQQIAARGRGLILLFWHACPGQSPRSVQASPA